MEGYDNMNELEKILNELSSIIDDQEYMEKEFEVVREYCNERNFELSEDELKTIKTIGLEDWIADWRNGYEKV